MSSMRHEREKTRLITADAQKLGRLARLAAMALLLVMAVSGCGGKQDREAAHFDRGKKLFAQGDTIAAGAEFENTVRINPANVEARFYLALTQESRRRWRRAQLNLDEILRRDPAHVGAMVHRGLLYLREKSPNRAMELANRALGIESKNVDALHAKAASLLHLGDRHRALAYAEQVIALDPLHVKGTILTARIHIQRGAYTSAVRILETAIEKMPDEIALRLALDRTLTQAGDIGGLVHVRREIVAADPAHMENRLQLALALELVGEVEEARGSLQEALALDPDRTETRLALAGLLFRHEDMRGAEALLRSGMKEHQANAGLSISLARLYEASGDPERAKELYRSIISNSLDQHYVTMARRMLARRLLAESKFAEARELVAKILADVPNDSMAVFIRAQIRLALGQLDGAVADIDTGLQSWASRNTEDIGGYVGVDFLADGGNTSLIHSPLVMNDWRAIRPRLESAVRRYPNSQRLHNAVGELWMLLGDDQTAASAFRSAMELSPNWITPYQNLAAHHYRNGSLELAIDTLERGVVAVGSGTGLHLQLANYYVQLGDIQRAKAAYRELLKESPTSSVALNNLVMLLTDDRSNVHDLDNALELARGLDLRNPLFADTVGWVHYVRDEFHQALPILERAAEKIPGNAEVQFHLGMVYFRLGEADRARQWLRLAIEGRPDSQWSNEARTVLEKLTPPA